jgi:hypothetical protein
MRRILVALVAALVAAAVLTSCAGSLRLNAPAGSRPAAGFPLISAPSIPLGGRRQAELNIVAGFASVSITAGAIGGRLLELSGTPGSAAPSATLAGDIVAVGNAHPSSGPPASDTVQIVLNPNVRWHVVLSGGATAAIVDLSAASVSAVDVTQGVSSLEVSLPAESGTTALTLTAGVSSLRVHTHGNEPARATLSAGAGSAVIDGVAHSGIAAGSSYAGTGWDAAASRVDLECAAGVGSLIIDQI